MRRTNPRRLAIAFSIDRFVLVSSIANLIRAADDMGMEPRRLFVLLVNEAADLHAFDALDSQIVQHHSARTSVRNILASKDEIEPMIPLLEYVDRLVLTRTREAMIRILL